jgi:hypothetical protein
LLCESTADKTVTESRRGFQRIVQPFSDPSVWRPKALDSGAIEMTETNESFLLLFAALQGIATHFGSTLSR